MQVQVGVAREVIVVPQLDAVPARVHREAAPHERDRADEPTVDVDLRVADVRRQVDDRVVRRHAALARRAAALDERDEQHEGPHGAPPVSVTSTTSPTIFTELDTSLAGGFFAICAIRSIASLDCTPITQPEGESR